MRRNEAAWKSENAEDARPRDGREGYGADSRPIVSVIIPCFNAGRWLREAIDSCLCQGYAALEIIVVDDGSTDETTAILKSYGGKIRWTSGPNRGGNYARNRGFVLSTGAYIQYLDADDYLLPEKIERQVRFLEVTGADAVYGDWRHKHHLPNGQSALGPVVLSGERSDLLEALLSGWWVAPCALLFRREAVKGAAGWDEQLRAAQDTDFMIRSALAGVDMRYQPGCWSVYRRYGPVTVSTSNPRRYLESHVLVLQKAERQLSDAGKLGRQYRLALARSYFSYARSYYDIDRQMYDQLLDKVLLLDPQFVPSGTGLFNLAYAAFGLRVTESMACFKRRLLRQLSNRYERHLGGLIRWRGAAKALTEC